MTFEMEKCGRNVGIDVLRIIAMFLITMMHVCTQGGIIRSVEPFTANYTMTWCIMIATYCAVNCYALISGYVGVDSNFSYHRIVVLWARVLFYTLLVTVAFDFIRPKEVGILHYIKAITPATTGQYWYFSAYFALFFFIPFLNKLINVLNEKSLNMLVFSLIMVFSILPTVRHTDPFLEGDGYSTLWLGVVYIIGAWLKKTQILYRYKKRLWFMVWAVTLLILIVSKFMLERICFEIFGRVAGGGLLISYISPLVLIEAIALCGICVQIKLQKSKGLTKISSLAFSVYIINQHPFLKAEFMRDKFIHFATYSPIKLVASILGVAIVIFTVCVLLDWIRDFLFRICKVSSRAKFILEGLRWGNIRKVAR